MCKCFLYKSKMFFSLNQGFLSAPLEGPLEEYILWKETEKSVACKEKLLSPPACPLTKNYRSSDRKLYTIDRHLVGRSGKQHPVTLATSRNKALNHFAHPYCEILLLTKFYNGVYTNVKPWSLAYVNHTHCFWEFVHCAGETQTTQGSSF